LEKNGSGKKGTNIQCPAWKSGAIKTQVNKPGTNLKKNKTNKENSEKKNRSRTITETQGMGGGGEGNVDKTYK